MSRKRKKVAYHLLQALTNTIMWKIRYKDTDGFIRTVYVKSGSINEAITKFEENYNELIESIDHDPYVDFIT